MLTLAIILGALGVILLIAIGIGFVHDEPSICMFGGAVGILFIVLSSSAFYEAARKEYLGQVAGVGALEDGRIYQLVGQTQVLDTEERALILNDGKDGFRVIWGDKSLPPGIQYFRKGNAPKKTEENQLVPVGPSAPPATMPSGQ